MTHETKPAAEAGDAKPVAWISAMSMSLLKTKKSEMVWVSSEPANDQDKPLYSSEAYEAVKRERDELQKDRDEADHKLVDRYRNPKTGTFNFPGDVAAIVRRLDAAERERDEARALLDEALEALERLERDASDVGRIGAKPGRQWTLLAGSLILSRTTLTKIKTAKGQTDAR